MHDSFASFFLLASFSRSPPFPPPPLPPVFSRKMTGGRMAKVEEKFGLIRVSPTKNDLCWFSFTSLSLSSLCCLAKQQGQKWLPLIIMQNNILASLVNLCCGRAAFYAQYSGNEEVGFPPPHHRFCIPHSSTHALMHVRRSPPQM